MLELEFVELRKPLGAFEICRSPFLVKFDIFAKRVFQSTLDQIDCEIGDVDPDPLPPKFLSRVDGCPTTAEGIEHDVAFVTAGFDKAFE